MTALSAPETAADSVTETVTVTDGLVAPGTLKTTVPVYGPPEPSAEVLTKMKVEAGVTPERNEFPLASVKLNQLTLFVVVTVAVQWRDPCPLSLRGSASRGNEPPTAPSNENVEFPTMKVDCCDVETLSVTPTDVWDPDELMITVPV